MTGKKLPLIIAGIVLVLSVAACSEASEPQGTVTSQDVKREAKEALDTATTYTRAQKDAYLHKLQARYDDIEQKTRALMDKAEYKAADLKRKSHEQFNQDMEALIHQQKKVAKKLDELKTASGDAWQDLRSGTDQALDELSRAFDQAAANFKQ